MSTITAFVSKHLAPITGDKRGVTALEYGVIAAVTVVVVATAFVAIGTNLTALFGKIAGEL